MHVYICERVCICVRVDREIKYIYECVSVNTYDL